MGKQNLLTLFIVVNTKYNPGSYIIMLQIV